MTVEVLHVSECWALARSAAYGRLAVWVEGRPEIVPVNHIVDHGSIVLRTGFESRVAFSTANDEVVFETDDYDAVTGDAWSVEIRGRTSRISNLHELVDSAQLPLSPWHPGPKHLLIRLEPNDLSGRRFHVADPSIWANALTGAPTSHPE